jgi:hypothetical protein
MTKKGFKQREQKTIEVCPGLAHRTVRCATGQCPVYQETQLQTRHLRENQRALRYNSPDCPVCQRSNGYFKRQWSTATHLMRACARRGQSTRSWRTGQSTVLVRCTTGQPEDPTYQSSNGRTLTAGWHGWRTGQCPMAHRTIRCARRQQPPPNG